jgi:hypothetical protein
MKIAVLFDGGGLARYGLEKTGHKCVGFEADPFKHYLSQKVGSGNCVLADATKVKLDEFDAVWASPPCQWHSQVRISGDPISPWSEDLLEWSLSLKTEILWVENVIPQYRYLYFGKKYNAAQFLPNPVQNRNRMFGGRFKEPIVYHQYKRRFPTCFSCVTATEWKGLGGGKGKRAANSIGRKLKLEECANLQGLPLSILTEWVIRPRFWPETYIRWAYQLYEAIGNGVPTYMSFGFGRAYKP